MVRLCLLVGVAAASATSRARVDAAWGGLSAYFADPTAHFWKSCGQNGGNGAGVDRFNCACEVAGSFCVNCYRWWMAVTVPSEGERRVTHAPCWCMGQSGVGGRAAKASGAKLASCSAETWV